MLQLSALFLRDTSFNMNTTLRHSFIAAVFAASPALAQTYIPEMLVSEGTTRALVDFNTPGEDFSAVPISNEELVFVSSRKGPNSKKKDPETNQYFFDLYIYNRSTKEVRALFSDEGKNPIASKFNLGPVSYVENSEIIVSRNNLIPNKDGIVTFNLTSVNVSDPSTAKILPFVKKEYSYLHPFYDAKRQRLYFSSNERGGKGGFDVYYSERLLDGGWGPAIPLSAVNTSRDEVFPTVAPNGTILFSKVVPKQGLNIFAYDIKSNQIQELASPFNTSLDDFGIVFDTPHSGYISQSQSGRYNTDIVRIEGPQYKTLVASGELPAFDDFVATPKPTSEEVVVVTSVTENVNVPKELAALIPTDGQAVSKEQIMSSLATQSGEEKVKQLEALATAATTLTVEVDKGKKQVADFDEAVTVLKNQLETLDKSSPDYYAVRESLLLQIVETTTARNRANADYNSNLSALTTISQVQEITSTLTPKKDPSLSNYPDITNQWGSPDLVLLFGFDKSTPLSDYSKQFKAILKDLPNDITGVFIVGHADSRGSESYNVGLSNRRAKSVQKLVGKTITTRTLGFGESHLKNDCGDSQRCPETQHLQNRRVEVWFY
jgi:outer membrane protein OmpA-like peptidoglycan-associated protein